MMTRVLIAAINSYCDSIPSIETGGIKIGRINITEGETLMFHLHRSC